MSASPTLALGAMVSIYDPQAIERAMEKATGQAADGLLRLYTKMLDAGPQRFVTKPAGAAVLDPVFEACPNFGGVLEDLANYIELAVVNRRGFSMQPLLLVGDPGVGKTHFAKVLAGALALPYQFFSMGTMSAGWILSGSAPTWAGARHGKVAEALIEEEFANPLCLLDELDKTGGDGRYDPYGALLQLLERETATHFKDEYLDLEVDASGITWVATANDLSRIPDYILSRMAVYEVPAPTPEQAAHIGRNIYDALVAELDWAFEPELRDNVLQALASVAPREMKKKLTDALARAVRQRRDHLEPGDIRSSHVRESRGIGFVA